MQSIVRRHRELDGAAGHEPRVLTVFETAPAGGPDIGLGAGWWWTPGGVRRAFRHHGVPAVNGALAVYHNGWSLPLLAPGDGAQRRLAYLHTEWPGLAVAVRASARWCDGIICVSEALVAAVHRAVPDYPKERVHRIHYPVDPPADARTNAAADGPRPFRVGYVGRLDATQKRVERFPELMRAWPAGGGAVEWQVLGDGPERRRLERLTAAAGSAQFHGWLSGQEYWRALAALDAVVFFSDYEGTPIALLEAMSVGVTPVFPAIGGDGEALARGISPECVYPAGDLAAAARQLQTLAGRGQDERAARARRAVAAHTPANYAAEFTRMVEATWRWPRHSETGIERRGRWSDLLPMALVRRYHEKAIWS